MTRALRWLPALSIASGIFWLSHQPGTDLPGTGFDKVEHAFAYGVLALCLWYGYAGRLRAPQAGKCSVVTLISATLYGLSDEFHQSFIPGRDASVFDWFADIAGAGLVVGMLFWASFAGPLGVWDNRPGDG